MKNVRYYITSLNLSAEPDIGEVELASATIDIVLPQEPLLEDDGKLLRAEFEFEVELVNHEGDPDKPEEMDEEIVGDIDIEFVATIEGEEGEFSDVVDTWKDEGYPAVRKDFRFYFESGIMSDVLAPVSNVIDSSVRGLIPAVQFSRDPNDVQEENGEKS